MFCSSPLTAAAIAAATTRMMIATTRLGRKRITLSSRSLIGLGPKTPNASWSTNSSSV